MGKLNLHKTLDVEKRGVKTFDLKNIAPQLSFHKKIIAICLELMKIYLLEVQLFSQK